ncbi:hypothetical protein ANANG_G00250990 [Anguilla anguilla]|uniref:Uncharacterized protein n=1 Tax=Anguilla anguilla TaxID=7936 RepID=A0A9D3RMI8_ANGAN|nr:hypothetical protein ANANG_G00250990 [Anguilla anguilla]
MNPFLGCDATQAGMGLPSKSTRAVWFVFSLRFSTAISDQAFTAQGNCSAQGLGSGGKDETSEGETDTNGLLSLSTECLVSSGPSLPMMHFFHPALTVVPGYSAKHTSPPQAITDTLMP